MHKGAVKELLYGGLKELTNNSRYYYHSSVSRQYNSFTDEGKIALYEFTLEMAAFMRDAEDQELDQRAKDIVLKELKREN